MDLLNPPRLDKKAIRKYCNRAASSYDQAAVLYDEVQKRLLERLHYMRHQPQTIVDVGCGTGKAVRGLQRAYPRARVYGLDLAEAMLLRARSNFRLLSRKRLVAGDMERLPFAAQSFDLVFSSQALPWCNDLKQVLHEFVRVMRPGGLLLFASFGPATLRELALGWQAVDEYPHVHRFIDMHDVGDAMMAAGLAQPVVDKRQRERGPWPSSWPDDSGANARAATGLPAAWVRAGALRSDLRDRVWARLGQLEGGTMPCG